MHIVLSLLTFISVAASAAAQAPDRIAGCYDFPAPNGGYFGWRTRDPARSTVISHESSVVELHASRQPAPGREWKLRVPTLQDTAAAQRHAGSSWRPFGEDSLELSWSDGFGGIRMRLAVRGDTLVGRASHFGDVLGPPPPWFKIRGIRVECPRLVRP